MPTIKQIIDNQEKNKENILQFFKEEINQSKSELRGIKTTDEFIVKEKEKLLRKFKKTNTLDSIKKYFFLSSKRDLTYYLWWENNTQEALILRYDKK
mgnify:FL=1|jgi:hypothetical protein